MSAIDLHSHVVPPTIIEALLRAPERFGIGGAAFNGVKVTERDGALHFDNNGRLTLMERELYDVEAKLAAMDRMGIAVSALSVAPPTYFYALGAEAGLAAARLSNDGSPRWWRSVRTACAAWRPCRCRTLTRRSSSSSGS
jgi:aminocarboxymuconate-semialdehyde decarboxylase